MHPIKETVASFVTASRALVGVAAESLAAEDDITLPQFRALVVMSRPAAVSSADLATALGVHQSTVTRLCDRLVRKGLAGRVTDTNDRRRITVFLTEHGARLVERVTERRAASITSIVRRMSPTERDRAVGALNAFARAAGEPAIDVFGWNRCRS